jgi:hypothetical protein
MMWAAKLSTSLLFTLLLVSPAAAEWVFILPHIQDVCEADFDGDGRKDSLLLNNVDGLKTILLSRDDGGAPYYHNVQFQDLNWRIVACADFTGDGVPDTLERHASGDVAIRPYYQGCWCFGDLVFWHANPGDGWRIQSAADKDGNGIADIIWRGPNWERGIWYMSGSYGYPFIMAPIYIHKGAHAPQATWHDAAQFTVVSAPLGGGSMVVRGPQSDIVIVRANGDGGDYFEVAAAPPPTPTVSPGEAATNFADSAVRSLHELAGEAESLRQMTTVWSMLWHRYDTRASKVRAGKVSLISINSWVQGIRLLKLQHPGNAAVHAQLIRAEEAQALGREIFAGMETMLGGRSVPPMPIPPLPVTSPPVPVPPPLQGNSIAQHRADEAGVTTSLDPMVGTTTVNGTVQLTQPLQNPNLSAPPFTLPSTTYNPVSLVSIPPQFMPSQLVPVDPTYPPPPYIIDLFARPPGF